MPCDSPSFPDRLHVAVHLPPPRLTLRAPPAAAQPMKIGIIGTGEIGGALARHWAAAGHQLLISSRHPEQLQALAKELGPEREGRHAARSRGLRRGGAACGAVSRHAPGGPRLRRRAQGQSGAGHRQSIPVARWRDGGARSHTRHGRGIGGISAGHELVRAFNAINSGPLAREAFRKPERIGIPLAADDADGDENRCNNWSPTRASIPCPWANCRARRSSITARRYTCAA